MKKKLTVGQQMGKQSQKKYKERIGEKFYKEIMKQKALKRWGNKKACTECWFENENGHAPTCSKRDGDKSSLQDTSTGI